jgi:hypothetical protein
MTTTAHDRLLLSKGVLKALFTTSPTKASEVIVQNGGKVVVVQTDEGPTASSASG